VAEIVENGFNIVVLDLCLTISRWKVLEDGFEDGDDWHRKLQVLVDVFAK